MNINDTFIVNVGKEVLKAELLSEVEWQELALIVEVAEGYFSDSGFLYNGSDIEPFDAYSENPLALRNAISELNEEVLKACGNKFKLLLIQMEKETGRIKIDFEFDDPNRWTIKPAKLKEMQESLRPEFD
jgi:hypothetical protein